MLAGNCNLITIKYPPFLELGLFLVAPSPYNIYGSPYLFLVVGLPKHQLPTTCLCNSNANPSNFLSKYWRFPNLKSVISGPAYVSSNVYAPRAIRSYVISLLQAGYQTYAPCTMIIGQWYTLLFE